MKKSLGFLAILAGIAALGFLIWIFFGSNTGTFVRFNNRSAVTAEPAGTCYTPSGTFNFFTLSRCKSEHGDFTEWCKLGVPKGDPSCTQGSQSKTGLCAVTQFSTTYRAITSQDQCSGGADNKFYQNCTFKPGMVPPWECSGQTPPPVPAGSGGSANDPRLGLCAVTGNSGTSYVNQNITYDVCKSRGGNSLRTDFYPTCSIAPSPVPWSCRS